MCAHSNLNTSLRCYKFTTSSLQSCLHDISSLPADAGSAALAVVSARGALTGSGEGSGLDSASGSGVAPSVPVSVGKLWQSAVMSRNKNNDNDDADDIKYCVNCAMIMAIGSWPALCDTKPINYNTIIFILFLNCNVTCYKRLPF